MLKAGIICAADTELAPFLPHIEDVTVTERAMLRFYEGTINGVAVVAVYSGVCKVNAAIAAQVLIDHYTVNAMVNAGTAGGIDQKVALFDTVISTQAVYHDVAKEILTEFHPWMESIYFQADAKFLEIAKEIAHENHAVHLGCMATGEKFIEDHMREAIMQTYAPLSVDMETASIAHVCYANHIPFIAVRSITDTAEHAGLEHFERNCKKASHTAKDVVLTFLQKLNGDMDKSWRLQ